MKLFGRHFSFQWPVRARDFVPTPAEHGAPFYNPPSGLDDLALDQRGITADPRELWFLQLPWLVAPKQVLAILRMALGGDLWNTWMLNSLMLDSWATYRMAQHQLREAVAYTKYNFIPHVVKEGEEPTDSAVAKAKFVERCLATMSPDQFSDEKGAAGTIYDFTDAALNGISMQELMYPEQTVKGPDGQSELPIRATAWVHPRHFTFTTDGKVSLYKDDYSYAQVSFMQMQSRRSASGRPPDPRKFVCSQFISRSGSSLGAGFMRPIAYLWSLRQYGWEYMANASRKWGTPFIDFAYQPNRPDLPGGITPQEEQKYRDFCRRATIDRYLTHPATTTVNVTPAQSLGPDNPTRWTIEQADRECLFLLLGQSATTMSQPGKLGEEGTHADVKDERVQGLADWVANNPLTYFARALLKANTGSDAECPTPKADFTKPLDSAQVSQLVVAVANSQLMVRQDELYEKAGFTPPQPGEVVCRGGQMFEAGEILTQDELETMRQEAQAYEQLAAQAQSGNEEAAKAAEAIYVSRAKRKAGTLKRFPTTPAGMRSVLASASKDELDQLEGLVERAQRAGTGNGEWQAVKVKVQEMAANRPRRSF